MPVLTLMYHRVHEPNTAKSRETFERHLDALKSQYPIVVPGDSLSAPLSICLTFDDAYVDFYHVVFPLLMKWQIKAILAIPTAYIMRHTTHTMASRIQVPYPDGMTKQRAVSDVPFCTWAELKEMVDTGLVIPASHGHTHAHLDRPDADLETEVIQSKIILEDNLGVSVDQFVYPYGDFSRRAHAVVSAHYQYIHRIGSALNRSWHQNRQLLYRVDAEHFWPQNKTFTTANLQKWRRRYWWNWLRQK